jgi:hypothetical protein
VVAAHASVTGIIRWPGRTYVRIRRLLVGVAALTTTVALLPPNPAVATTKTTASPQSAAAAGRSFDPAHAYVPGSPLPLTEAATVAAPDVGAAPVGHAAANGGTLSLKNAGSVETAQGTPLTDTLANGDSLQVFNLGVVSRTRPDGTTVWQRGVGSLYRDYKLSFDAGYSYTPSPQLAVSTDPADPFQLSTAGPFGMRDTQPYAVGDLTGDGEPDVAVAETVGVNLGAASCGNCAWRFTVPGSDLKLGTFVTVLDGRTGTTVYHELDPGFVTQLAISAGELLIGDETGSPAGSNGLGRYGSQSTVRAIALRGSKAVEQWTWSTGAEWGLLLGLHVVGSSVAVAWSDTPVGLGVPGPPDGHVVLLDQRGRTSWDKRTAGYPVLSGYDTARGELAVVELTDPTAAIGYTLDALRVSDGRTLTAAWTPDVLPTVLTLSGKQWLVAGVVTSAAEVSSPYYGFDSATVAAVDPATGTKRWTGTLADGALGAAQPGSVAVAGDAIVVGSFGGGLTPTAADPYDELGDLQGFSATTGAARWHQAGDLAGPLTLAVAGARIRGVNAELDGVSYAPDTGRATGRAPLLSDLYTATAADVDGDRRPDYIAGSRSGAVYAFDGRTLKTGGQTPGVLWRTVLGGPVHQIVPATVDGRAVLAVAATTELDLLDRRTGRVLHTMPLPGQYAWNVAVGTVAGRPVVVSATDRVVAFDASSGKARWAFQPGSVYFADAAVVDGTVLTEYQSQQDTAAQPAVMAAVGLDAATGRTAWTAAADPGTTWDAQLWNGVAAGPGIPGAGADGAALTWDTPDGSGRVDVRNARTGALLYSNTDGNLTNHTGFVIDPAVGLVAAGHGGTVEITPGGPIDAYAAASGAGVVRSAGTPVLITADTLIQAWPLSVFGSADVLAPLADAVGYLAGGLSVTSDDQAVSMPIDWEQYEVLATEEGKRIHPYAVSVLHGLEVITASGRPAAKAARRAQAAPNQPVARPDTLPLGDNTAIGRRSGVAQPSGSVRVRGYDAHGQPLLTAEAPTGYDPATIRAYLGLTGTGQGQTVAVVDAPGDPAIRADVDHFSDQFGLPPVNLTVKTPQGAGDVDGSWGLETTMDVEWIHATAPDATIVLVESHDSQFSSLFAAVDAAAGLKPDAISLSWGIPEEFTDETYYDAHCALSATLCTVASGDRGWPGSYPAYNPHVLAVGGTTLNLATGGSVTGETAWSGSGGGRSYVEGVPPYQTGLVTGGRGIPDVSYVADPQTGVPVYDTTPDQGQTGWFQVGGTSLGAPSWAAVVATADQLRTSAGQARLTEAQIYAGRSDLGDVLSGTNGSCPGVCAAGPGYDFVTGLGSPRAGLDAKLARR